MAHPYYLQESLQELKRVLFEREMDIETLKDIDYFTANPDINLGLLSIAEEKEYLDYKARLEYD
jgi:hypothetical protein